MGQISFCVLLLTTAAIVRSAPATFPDFEVTGMLSQPRQKYLSDGSNKDQEVEFQKSKVDLAVSSQLEDVEASQDYNKPEPDSEKKNEGTTQQENKRVKRQYYDHSHCYHDHCHDYYSDGHSHVRYHNYGYGYNRGYGYNNRGWGYNRWNRRWWG